MEFHGQERRCQHAGIRTPLIKQARPGLSGCECLGDKDRTDRTSLPQEGGWGGRDEGCNRGGVVSMAAGAQERRRQGLTVGANPAGQTQE